MEDTGHNSRTKFKKVSLWQLTWHRFCTHRIALLSGIILLLFIVMAIAAPALEYLSGQNSSSVNLLDRLASPSTTHILGTDELGRDVFLRILHGGRISLFVGLLTALLTAIFGTLIGISAGYYGVNV